MGASRSLPALLALLALGSACKDDPVPPSQDPRPDPEADANIFVALDDIGDPIPGLDAATRASYERGREVMARAFRTDQGLGPTFNADSCGSCHQFPVPGGSAPRYRDFWLVLQERDDGAMTEAGSNGISPVRNLYSTFPTGHVAEAEGASVYARRNTPSGFGIGLLEFIPDAEITQREDHNDDDGDGISGRANYEQGRVGRFGYKAQASSMESFNRGAMLNQMGLTSNPLFHEFEVEEEETASWWPGGSSRGLLDGVFQTAHAQVSAPGQPTIDDDFVADPEMSDQDQLDLLIFSTYLAPPRPESDLSPAAERGAALFDTLACSSCHTPRLDSSLGPLPVYSDLLLHDMGEARADGIGPGFATGSEFRTQPLWGVALHGPFLHDGAADTLDEAIRLHGGEGQGSADAYAALSDDGRADLEAFLQSLGGADPDDLGFTRFENAPPDEGDPGGPVPGLTDDEYARWLDGRAVFDRNFRLDDGLGSYFNADSCRACHQDPVVGGAGGADTSVIRVGHRTEEGVYESVGFNVMPRVAVVGGLPLSLPSGANTIELRQPPTVQGVGLIDALDESVILANNDPDDLDGDGISGRARFLHDGRVGRYGWKAQIASTSDFVADALLQELGVTIHPDASDFTLADDGDAVADPELDAEEATALGWFLDGLAPPQRAAPADPDAAAAGEQLFADVGCADCHTPSLGGVPAYSDLLLHEVWPDGTNLVEQEDGVAPTEFRTPPLWGLRDTAPYLHNGSAPTVEAAIAAHAAEAEASREAWMALDEAEQAALRAFLDTL